MRVLLVGPRPPPTGGVATHVGELAAALAEGGIRARVVDPRRRGPNGRDGRAQLIAQLVGARWRGDLVHLHTNGHNRKSWLLGAACAGPRSIVTIHSGLAPEYLRRHPRLARAVCRRYAHVIAVNDEIARSLRKITDVGITVCPAFSRRSLAFRLPPHGLAQLRARHRPLYACALAPGREYGAELLLDAFAAVYTRSPSAGLILYGPGTRELADEVARRGLRQSVALLGELRRERALAVMAACDVFVRPTLADGDALSVREALALGRTVVASSVGHRPEAALTFPAGSAAACAELLFHAASSAAPEPLDGDDALSTVLALYQAVARRIWPQFPAGGGQHPDAATVGTALAI